MNRTRNRLIESIVAAVILTINLLPAGTLAETPASETPDTTPAVTAQASSSSSAPSLSVTSSGSDVVVGDTDDTYTVTVAVNAISGSSTMSASRDIILLVDVSGSMYGTPLDNVKTAIKNFVSQVSVSDPSARFSLISNANEPEVGTDLTSSVSSIDDAVDDLSAGGITYLAPALDKAAEEFSQNGRAGSNKTVIVLSDGDVFDSADSKTAAENLVTSYPNATIDTIGYGSGADEDFLKKIATTSNAGTYSSSEIGAINGVLADIGSSITPIDFSRVTVSSPKPDRFTLVPRSFSTLDGLTLDQGAFDNGVVSVTSGTLAGGESLSFSYDIKIDQDAAAKADYLHNILDFTATGEYVLSGETSSFSAHSSLDAHIYLVSTSTDGNGTISASRFVGHGASYGVTWTANAGYVISSLSENGSALSAEDMTGSVSVGPVSSDVAVQASFATTTTPPIPTSTGGASVTPSPLPQTDDDSPWPAVATSACVVLLAGVVTRRRGTAA